jgi:shikimate dehydrogenase
VNLQLALIGRSINQSRMPKLQMYLGQLVGIDVHYHLHSADNIDVFSLQHEIEQLRLNSYAGVNITQPFKQDAWYLFKSGHSNLGLLGAFNTLKFNDHDENPSGYNTDYSGFVSAFKRCCGEVSPGRVLQLGAGGVGRAVAYGLAKLGVRELMLFDKNMSQAEQLAIDLPQVNSRIVTTLDELEELMQCADGLVNCTPQGMYYSPASAFPKLVKGRHTWAFDAVYTPLNTEFLLDCKAASMTIISGYDLWIHQGLDAFEIFTGAPLTLTDAMLKETLSWLD